MMSDPLAQLLETAQQSGFVSGEQRSRMTQEFCSEKPSTMQDAAALLVAEHVLTPGQAQQLLSALEKESTLAGRYQILEKLGEGGMGAVYKARDTKLDRLVAIKVMADHQVQHPDAVARFRREAKALAKVSHPAIVQAHDADHDGERHFLVMEFVEGCNLARMVHDHGKLAPTRAADFICQAALGIHHAHERGLIHRDLKPANLLVTPQGLVKILDLGLARFSQDLIADPQMTREGVGMGTPDYMAPEQFQDARNVDARGDVYALGCTLYHLIAGVVPFPGSSLAEKASAHEHREPPPLEQLCPDVPAGLALAVRKMMAKKPADRFQSAREVAEALAPYVAGSSASLPQIAVTTDWQGSQLSFTLTKTPARRRSYRGAIIATAGAAFLGIGLVFAWPWLFPREPEAPPDKPPVIAEANKKDDKPLPPKVDPKAQPETKEKKPEMKETKPEPPKVETIPNGLTVAQDGTGQFKTISEALAKVEPGMTIRVLDDAIYRENLAITKAALQSGITLEAAKGATVSFPKGKIGLYTANVPKVTIRGFRLSHEAELLFMVVAGGKCQGLRLDGLHVKINDADIGGFSLEGCEPGDEPVSVDNCTIQGGRVGLRVSGYGTPQPCQAVVLRNNTIMDAQQGMFLVGAMKQIQVTGNRIGFAHFGAIQLESLLSGTENVLIANNTMLGCGSGIRLWDNGEKKDLGKKIALINNLILGCSGPDMVFLDSGGDDQKLHGPGPGRTLLAAWSWETNWREATEPTGTDVFSKSWIPIAPADKRQDKIEILSRDPRKPNFLKPAKDSPLAKGGKGGDLPSWVGAVPPDGAAAWDWQWTWDAVVHNRLTVSKDSKTGGRFRTLNEALDKVRPGMTIRVVDKEVYTEILSLTNATTQTGVVLESPLGAVIATDQPQGVGVLIKRVPNLTLRGFRLRADAPRLNLIVIKDSAPGLLLDGLTFERGSGTDYDAVVFHNLNHSASDSPAVIQNCIFRKPQLGIGVTGKDLVAGSYQPCRSVAVRNNLFLEPTVWGISLQGHLERIQVVGNRIGKGSKLGAMQLEDLSPDTRDLLLANNTICDVPHAFRLWDAKVKGTRVDICNNLFLGVSGPDMIFLNSGGSPIKIRGPGDGQLLHKSWKLSHNRRETRAPEGAGVLEKSWIPPGPKDVLEDRIEVMSRLPNDPDYLKLPPNSKLAKAGAGGDLPAYVGALPPQDAEVWDWNRTWLKWHEEKK